MSSLTEVNLTPSDFSSTCVPRTVLDVFSMCLEMTIRIGVPDTKTGHVDKSLEVQTRWNISEFHILSARLMQAILCRLFLAFIDYSTAYISVVTKKSMTKPMSRLIFTVVMTPCLKYRSKYRDFSLPRQEYFVICIKLLIFWRFRINSHLTFAFKSIC